ncbi:hypothetical protein ABEB36_007632 [Hypothenemus hampei]|uniref:Uncharacterized protein n=1 Tax=Hypothenemus hampei TaxID=57062 RepID=A0ABD1EVN1_HYPHA
MTFSVAQRTVLVIVILMVTVGTESGRVRRCSILCPSPGIIIKEGNLCPSCVYPELGDNCYQLINNGSLSCGESLACCSGTCQKSC